MKRHYQQPGDLVPPGFVAARSWLMGKNVQRHTVDNWLKSGQLVAVARGVFKRPEAELSWQGVVCSLQRMGLDLTPGGLTSLALQGMTHHLSFAESAKISLYGHQHLPEWVKTVLPETTFLRHSPLELDSGIDDPSFHLVPWKTQVSSFGHDKTQLQISSPELAMFEVLMDVPRSVSFEHANNLLQGLPTLSPQKVARLLEHCRNVKAKRLFLWLAERNQSPWLKKLDLKRFSIEGGALGAGKRVIAEDGKLDRKYLITVPPEMAGENYGQE